MDAHAHLHCCAVCIDDFVVVLRAGYVAMMCCYCCNCRRLCATASHADADAAAADVGAPALVCCCVSFAARVLVVVLCVVSRPRAPSPPPVAAEEVDVSRRITNKQVAQFGGKPHERRAAGMTGRAASAEHSRLGTWTA